MSARSTRGRGGGVELSAALLAGMAPDGGLYLPEHWPRFDIQEASACADLPAMAGYVLIPFFNDDPLAPHLHTLIARAFAFPAPTVSLDGEGRLWRLELYHGPTGAFKDFGAQFLAGALDRRAVADGPLTVLVATSGDTGGAVGAAFEGNRNARAVILFPEGRVSDFQRRQLTCWGGNTCALEVAGDFDACQGLVKSAFATPGFLRSGRLTSANSINLGRLLPQMAYFAYSAVSVWRETGEIPGVIVPTGNMGNVTACLWARACGMPIGPVIMATNANRTLADYYASGAIRPRPSLATLANAMDVGNPSNFERFRAGGEILKEGTVCESVDDEAIRRRIALEFQEKGQVWCPHGAVAMEAYHRLGEKIRSRPWIVTATAHPAKFADIVEPLIGEAVSLPPALQAVLARSNSSKAIAPDLGALQAVLEE